MAGDEGTVSAVNATSMVLLTADGAWRLDPRPGVLDGVRAHLEDLQANAPQSVASYVALARASLGHDSTIDFGLVKAASGPQLRLDLGWQRAYGVSRPVSLEIGDQVMVRLVVGP